MPDGAVTAGSYRGYQTVGLLLGPALFVALSASPVPAGLSPAGWSTAAVAVWMAAWWATEAVPLAATALLPLVLLPVLGIADARAAAAPYADPLIYLFLGGFVIAAAVQRWSLHRRIALHIVILVGSRPRSLVAGVMLATAVLSMWISNTATAMMMLPIAASLVAVASGEDDAGAVVGSNFATAMMLGVAYAASIGGLATLIGSPPNALAAGFLAQGFGVTVGFAGWMAVGVPVAVAMLPLAWLVLTRVAFPFADTAPQGGRDALAGMLRAMGPVSVPEKRVAAVFAAVAVCWILRPFLDGLLGKGLVTDTGLAIAGAVALFAIPADWRRREFLMDWPSAKRLPWEILVLFGGGLSLARAIETSGLAGWLGGGLDLLAIAPPVVLLVGVTLLVILLTELTSNTATTAALLPVVAAFADGTGLSATVVAMAVALAASSAYMLPVATPPNAIVFGSGYITLPQMLRAGLLLNLAGVAVITAVLSIAAT